MPSVASSSIHAAANELADTSVKTVPVAGGGVCDAPRSVLSRKTDIWLRVTVAAGQNFPPPQPVVMPSAFSCSIHAAANDDAETSVNTVPAAGGGAYAAPCSDLSRNTAICERWTG